MHMGRQLEVLPNTGDMNSLAVVVLVMVVGISAYLWWTGRLRSRAGLVTMAGIMLFLAYLAFFANQPPA
jgi:LPXTG-motif cell wall-anchored protein